MAEKAAEKFLGIFEDEEFLNIMERLYEELIDETELDIEVSHFPLRMLFGVSFLEGKYHTFFVQ